MSAYRISFPGTPTPGNLIPHLRPLSRNTPTNHVHFARSALKLCFACYGFQPSGLTDGCAPRWSKPTAIARPRGAFPDSPQTLAWTGICGSPPHLCESDAPACRNFLHKLFTGFGSVGPTKTVPNRVFRIMHLFRAERERSDDPE